MDIQLTIIGLGQIGASVGLALADHPKLVYRVGYDRDPDVIRQARKMGAVDKAQNNLNAAVQGSDLVLLALPLDEIRTTMNELAENLKAGTVLMDTAPVKEAVAKWAKDTLPDGCFYVGLTPVINPIYLHEEKYGVQAAKSDLFHNGLIAIVAPPNANSKSIKLAADLTRLLGADPLFAEVVEVDGLMTATHIVPQLMAAALLNATVDQPGWREARKLAGRAYAEVSGPIGHLGEPGALASTALLNREHVLRVTDSVIAALQSLRKDIENKNSEALSERLERARKGREIWWQQRRAADWAAEQIPRVKTSAASDVFGNLLRFGRRTKIRDQEDGE
jgi:prephenate dehydrogenase